MTLEREAILASGALLLAVGLGCAEPDKAPAQAASQARVLARSPTACSPCVPRILYETMLGPFGDGGQDCDGDGLADIVISNRNLHRDHLDGSRPNSIALISPQRCSTLREWTGEPGFGYRVAMSPDLDGDACPDVLVSVGDTRVQKGTAMIESPASRVLGLSGRTGDIVSDVSGLYLGDDIAPLGDLDGDGLADYAITIAEDLLMESYDREGSFGFEVRAGGTGKVLLKHSAYGAGYSVGFPGVRGIGDLDLDGTPDVAAALPCQPEAGRSKTHVVVISGRTGSTLAEIPSSFVGTEAHESLASAGDIDGDGLPDLVVGSENQNSAHVISLVDCRVLFDFHGLGVDAFGASVAGLGDANGDSIPDVAVGAPLFETTYDGLAYVRIISGADGSDLAIVLGERATGGLFDEAYVFGICVRAAGDVDGDGLTDVLIGEDREFGHASPNPDRVVVIGLTPG